MASPKSSVLSAALASIVSSAGESDLINAVHAETNSLAPAKTTKQSNLGAETEEFGASESSLLCSISDAFCVFSACFSVCSGSNGDYSQHRGITGVMGALFSFETAETLHGSPGQQSNCSTTWLLAGFLLR
jgi:hypothetical protein